MGGVLGHLLGENLRKEMKQKVEQIMTCGENWNSTAMKLCEDLEKLTAAIEASEKPTNLSYIKKSTSRLAGESRALSTAFVDFNKTINDLIERFG
jgi:hypothetical protein